MTCLYIPHKVTLFLWIFQIRSPTWTDIHTIWPKIKRNGLEVPPNPLTPPACKASTWMRLELPGAISGRFSPARKTSHPTLSFFGSARNASGFQMVYFQKRKNNRTFADDYKKETTINFCTWFFPTFFSCSSTYRYSQYFTRFRHGLATGYPP